jgi:RNase P protein component
MSESIGRNRARRVIKEIVREHGFVQESTLQLIDSLVSQEARREVEEALLAKDIKIGSSVLT